MPLGPLTWLAVIVTRLLITLENLEITENQEKFLKISLGYKRCQHVFFLCISRHTLSPSLQTLFPVVMQDLPQYCSCLGNCIHLLV